MIKQDITNMARTFNVNLCADSSSQFLLSDSGVDCFTVEDVEDDRLSSCYTVLPFASHSNVAKHVNAPSQYVGYTSILACLDDICRESYESQYCAFKKALCVSKLYGLVQIAPENKSGFVCSDEYSISSTNKIILYKIPLYKIRTSLKRIFYAELSKYINRITFSISDLFSSYDFCPQIMRVFYDVFGLADTWVNTLSECVALFVNPKIFMDSVYNQSRETVYKTPVPWRALSLYLENSASPQEAEQRVKEDLNFMLQMLGGFNFCLLEEKDFGIVRILSTYRKSISLLLSIFKRYKIESDSVEALKKEKWNTSQVSDNVENMLANALFNFSVYPRKSFVLNVKPDMTFDFDFKNQLWGEKHLSPKHYTQPVYNEFDSFPAMIFKQGAGDAIRANSAKIADMFLDRVFKNSIGGMLNEFE